MKSEEETTEAVAGRLLYRIGHLLALATEDTGLSDQAAFESMIDLMGTALFEVCVDTRDLVMRPRGYVGLGLVVRLRDLSEALLRYMKALATHDAHRVDGAHEPLCAALAGCQRMLLAEGFVAEAPPEPVPASAPT